MNNAIQKYLSKKGYETVAATEQNHFLTFVPYKESETVRKYLKKYLEKVNVRYNWNYSIAIFYI